MCYERIARNAAFAFASLALIGGLLGFSLEYEPYVSALAR
jgi:hypothetical protein